MESLNKLLRLVNEQNNPYREVSLENVVVSTPSPIFAAEFKSAGHYEVVIPEGVTSVDVVLNGAGGGSGGGIYYAGTWEKRYSTRGGHGDKKIARYSVVAGDVLSFGLASGGVGGTAGNPNGFAGRYNMGGFGGDADTSYFAVNNVQQLAARGGEGGYGADINRTYNLGGKSAGNGQGGRGGDRVGSLHYPTETTTRYGDPGNDGDDGSGYIVEYREGLEDRNTSVTLTGILNKGYKGSVDVYYKRNDLTSLFQGIDPTVRSREFSLQSVLDTINTRYGLFLETTDLVDGGPTIPTFSDVDLETVTDLEFRVRDDSYGWTGTVTIPVLYGNPVIDGVVLVQLLPILKHPDHLEELKERMSGTVSTWGFDFTAYKDDLQVDPETGEWLNFARVQEIGRLAGLSYWYNGLVVDLPTSAVPGANPHYERVMVQEATQGNVLGPIYFHYDINW